MTERKCRGLCDPQGAADEVSACVGGVTGYTDLDGMVNAEILRATRCQEFCHPRIEPITFSPDVLPGLAVALHETRKAGNDADPIIDAIATVGELIANPMLIVRDDHNTYGYPPKDT